ncbi:hypothetical protein KIPB_005726, partial [Kipferlia bialata]|eukprot:g5726.t1
MLTLDHISLPSSLMGRWEYEDNNIDGEDAIQRQIFVTGLPDDCTKEQLEEVFSAIAPPQRVALLQNRRERTLNGKAFITFTLTADVDDVLLAHSKEPIALNGKRLRITKARHKEETQEGPVHPKDVVPDPTTILVYPVPTQSQGQTDNPILIRVSAPPALKPEATPPALPDMGPVVTQEADLECDVYAEPLNEREGSAPLEPSEDRPVSVHDVAIGAESDDFEVPSVSDRDIERQSARFSRINTIKSAAIDLEASNRVCSVGT